ncbi:hypothetical protein [Thioalkalivibrio sp. ALE17]|uniref:hypothetical protein n=1 Tax=Thioalkalivibrio sp. ALE17 TaxID=1158173 RepID=UPI0012DE0E57|nr:hypothetical protein [Thioalkalivibrio sp. ALE17]
MHSGTFLWEVQHSPYPSQFLTGTRQFGESLPLYLVDQFEGKRPVLLNDEFLSNGEITFGMYPSALLDSNILDAIDKRVSGKGVSDGLEGFLRFVTEKGWDFSPMFYYMEHLAKSSQGDFLPNAIRRTEALLRLHSMNEDHFFATGEVIPNPEAVAHYTSEAGAKTLREVAEQRVTSFANDYERQALAGIIEATQIALIKMVLLHKFEQPKASPAKKHEEFIRFLREDLGIMLAREAHLALHYFCDRTGKLLGIQANTSVKKALGTVRSTAWDMFLLRFPEMLFSETPAELCIAYVATHEKRLQELARLFTIERIHSNSSSGFAPQVSYDLSSIPAEVVAEIPNDLDIPPSLANLSGRKSVCVPAGLLDALERELARLCGDAQPCNAPDAAR